MPTLASTTAFLTNRPGVDVAAEGSPVTSIWVLLSTREAPAGCREVQVEGVEPAGPLMAQLSTGTRTTSVVTPGVKVSVPLWPW